MTAQQLITEHIDLWTSSIKAKNTQGRGSSKKRELYGIKKLRELILELAVRGKLVPQDHNDEPASVLLELIEAEKTQLIKNKEIKKQKVMSEITEEEKRFKLPEGWEWVRVGYIGNIFNGNSVNAQLKEEKYTNIEGLPFIATKDVGYGFEPFDYSNGICIPVGEPKFKVARAGSVLICAEGGSAGKKCGIANRDVCFGNKLFANELYGEVSPAYILSNYLTPTFYGQFSDAMTGIIGGISTSKFFELVIPIPPINEQHRIVAKVDELMALCDQLEQQTESSLDAHNLLVDSLLTTLTDARDANELSDNWARLADHFDTLITTDYAVEQLKQTILQLAVKGKLVPQDPNDEPASELLKRIAAEKEQLIQDKKIKKQKLLPPITDEEKLFELPDGWAWCRFDALAQLVTSGSRGWKAFYSNSGSTFIRSQDIKKDKLEFDNRAYVDLPKSTEGVRTKVELNDLLMTITGANVAKVARIEDSIADSYVSQHVALIRLVEESLGKYLHIWLTGEHGGRELLLSSSYGAKPGLNLVNIRELIIPVAPIDEEHRIVAKVDQLMTLCDQLKACLKDAQSSQLHLADTVVDEALN